MAGGNFELLALENPLLDISAEDDGTLLEKYGLKANDAILAEDKHKTIYDELLAKDAKLVAGGAAQNTARGAQYLLPPNSTVFIGCVGKDKYADTLQQAADKAGLRVEYHIDDTVPTGRCGVVITGHNRSMVTDLAAANAYQISHLQSEPIWKLVQQAQVYYVGGYHLTVSPPAIMALAKEAAEKNKVFILSIAAPFIAQFFKDPLAETAPYWDYVIGNETEAAEWAKSQGLSESTPVREIAEKLVKLPKVNKQRQRIAIITQGTEPTVVGVGKEDGSVEIKEYPVHAIDAKDIYDTVGAGDAFAGGLVAGIVQGKSLDESIDMGQWLAKLSIRELGPQFPFPKQTYSKSG